MNENDLLSALTSMGFGETLPECKLGFSIGYSIDPRNIDSALIAFSLSDAEITAVKEFINQIK